MEPELLQLMTDIVITENANAYDGTGFGIPTYDEPIEHRAWIENKHRFVRNEAGQMDQITHTVYIDGEVQLTANDRITFPDGSTPRIVATEVLRDERGVHHTEVLCGGT
jgi:hypothetical protein